MHLRSFSERHKLACVESEGMVERTARLLRALSRFRSDGASTSQVAAASGLPRPTVHRLLTALHREGFVDRDTATAAWHLGPELFVLGSTAATRYDLTGLARPHVKALAAATGESAFFSARRDDETVCLLREDGDFPIRSFVLYEGARFPLGVVSAGQVILAHLPDREIDEYLDRVDLTADFGDRHNNTAVRERIRQTRTDGYSTNPGLVVEGSWGMAAAVFDSHERPEWALTLTGIEPRFHPERRRELGALLLKHAHALGKAFRARKT